MQKPSHYGFRLSPAFTVASNRKRLCRPPGLCRVLKQCVTAVTVSAAKTNARRLVVAVKDAVAAAGRQTPKKVL